MVEHSLGMHEALGSVSTMDQKYTTCQGHYEVSGRFTNVHFSVNTELQFCESGPETCQYSWQWLHLETTFGKLRKVSQMNWLCTGQWSCRSSRTRRLKVTMRKPGAGGLGRFEACLFLLQALRTLASHGLHVPNTPAICHSPWGPTGHLGWSLLT